MPGILDFLPMLAAQQSGRQQLARTPEPTEVTAADENIVQYDRVMGTKLVLAYATGLQIVYRAQSDRGGSAIDLACGPGHYTLCLAHYLGYDDVTGIDLSSGMVARAQQNAMDQGLADRVQFREGDATHMEDVPTDSLDMSSFTDAAHHMPDLETVNRVIGEMDRVTKPAGLVMVMDLARLRTEKLTERYVNTLGHDYVERGLPNFFADFRNSMYAAWTATELRQAIPTTTDRYWCHIVPRGLPTVQVILGLPVERKRVFVRSGLPWKPAESPVPPEMSSDWRMLRMTLRLASRKLLSPTSLG